MPAATALPLQHALAAAALPLQQLPCPWYIWHLLIVLVLGSILLDPKNMCARFAASLLALVFQYPLQ